MKKYITIILMLFGILSFGQTAVKKSSVSTGGGSATVGNTTVTYAIGEVAVQEATQGNTAVSEGFIGPDILASLGVAEYGVLQGVSVYPNPVKDIFTVKLSGTGTYEYYLYDLNGKQLLTRTADEDTEQFNISNLRTAVYVLVVIDRKNKRKKIVRLQKE